MADIAPYMQQGSVLFISRAYGDFPRCEQVGNVTHLRVDTGVPAREPSQAGKQGGGGRAYARAAAKELEGFEGPIYVGNRPQFATALRARAPNARLILYLGNLHFTDPAALATYDAFVVCSEFVADELHGALTLHRFHEPGATAGDLPTITVVRGGVDLTRFRPSTASERAIIKSHLGLGHGPIVLFVGRLDPTKGIHLLLGAASGVAREVPDVTFVVVGSSNSRTGKETQYERALRERAASLTCVKFTGFVPPAEVHRYWAAADIFCGPALWDEPLGKVYLESMASGVPPVGTARGGIPEVITDGETGLLLPRVPSVGDTEQRLVEVLRDSKLRERLSQNGRELAQEQFSLEGAAQAVENVLLSN